MINQNYCIRSIKAEDFTVWKLLYEQYLSFYKTSLTDEELRILWSWFFEPSNKIYAYLAIQHNEPVGLVHFREYLRPIKASIGVFIDDLYVNSRCRGQGIGEALIHKVNDFCQAKKITSIRWITAQDNDAAIKLYEKMAIKTPWCMYERTV